MLKNHYLCRVNNTKFYFMRKIVLLGMGLFMGFTAVSAQDTLIYENFDDTIIGTFWNYAIDDNYPNAILNDTMWYNYDEDQIPDASGGSRPGFWYLTTGYGLQDTNDIILSSNSWTNDGVNSVKNWLILPAIQITDGASAWLKWNASPFQTPRFCDGYEVRISTTDNDLPSFTDVVYTAAEYQSGAPTGNAYSGGVYTNYVFSSGFQHGADGQYIDCSECVDLIDSSRWRGLQRPDSVSLAAYDNMKIYIAFYHNTTDDNILGIDDILVIENTDPFFSVETLPDFAASVYPNPASAFINVRFDIEKYHNAQVQMMNNSGQMIYAAQLNEEYHQIDLTNIAAGAYFIKFIADEGTMVKKVVVTK